MQVPLHEAKPNLSRLIAAVEAGEEVFLARHNKPVAKLVPAKRSGWSRIGGLAGRPYRMGNRFDDATGTAALADDFGGPER
jgi:prevent-host-death family protein